MSIPLLVLAVLSVVGGWIGIPHVIAEILPWDPENKLEHWLEAFVAPIMASAPAEGLIEWGLMSISVTGAILASLLAYVLYCKFPSVPEQLAEKFKFVYIAIKNKYFVDEFYEASFINPLIRASEEMWLHVDVRIIDRVTYWLTDLSKGLGEFSRTIQTGNLQTYALYVTIGLATLMTLFLTL
jgi:NADH-quinone oxidoreductase subunit L